MTTDILSNEVRCHIRDGILSLRETPPDVAQAEHNFFEIATHLGIDSDEVLKGLSTWDVEFSYVISVLASSMEEAEAFARKIWEEEAPRPDEMNVEVSSNVT